MIHFAMGFAEDRQSQTLDIRDLLASMYVANLEKLAKYWEDWEDFELLVIDECGVTEPRWIYWMRSRDQESNPGSIVKDRSSETDRVWQAAIEIAYARGGSPEPLLTPHDLLLAIARDDTIELGRKLIASGLKLEQLQQAVKTLKTRPG
jgi:hypothetical protein